MTKRAENFVINESNLIYEDDDLIAFDKPAGLPSQPTLDPNRANLYGLAKIYLGNRPGAGHDIYLGMHHRLDVGTSGVVLFTKRKDVNKWISDRFRSRQVLKTYLALVSLPDQSDISSEPWRITSYLKKVKEGPKGAAISKTVRSGGQVATTDFRVIRIFEREALIEARPLTGRMHQIRVHLAEQGLPILGDLLYRLKDQIPSRLMLHAYQLELESNTGKNIKVEAKLPPEFEKLV